MLRDSFTYGNHMRYFSGRDNSTFLINSKVNHTICNAGLFGSKISKPLAYANQNAICMAIKANYYIAVICRGDSFGVANGTTYEVGASTFTGDSTIIANGTTLESAVALIQGDSTFSSNAYVREMLSTIIDAGARPSSFDIAQEVIESKIDGNYSMKDLLKIISGVLAGNTATIGTSTESSVVFRNISDTINILEATVTANNRSVTSINN